MHLIKPKGNKRKFDLRLRNHDGRTVKISGDRDRTAAIRLGQRIEVLVAAKQQGDPPPAHLAEWINNMPAVLAQRLVKLGLLNPRRAERLQPLDVHVVTFERIVAGRKTNTAEHAKRQASILRLLFKRMEVNHFDAITEDGVTIALGTMTCAAATRRHYIIAVKDFAKWMVRSGRAAANPFSELKAPGQYSEPTIERVPLTRGQFEKLCKYLLTFERYPHQLSRWTARDRRLIYWTAVSTAFRQGELRSLRVRSLFLDATPPQIAVKAVDSKHRMRGAVPIPNDLATALRAYVAGREDDEKVFPFPESNHGIVEMFRRDLSAVGIKWDFGDHNPETIDFHTLRSTAITWWLDQHGLPAKRVQILARLKTLALVAAYSRNLRLDEYSWLNDGPSVVGDSTAKSA